MQIPDVKLHSSIYIHVVRCASAHEAAPQLSNDTTNRKFHRGRTSTCWIRSATTCGVARRSTHLLRTPPTQSGVFPAVLGHVGFAGGFVAMGATPAYSVTARRAIVGQPPHDTVRPVPPVAGQATKLHENSVDQNAHVAASPCMQEADCNHPRMITSGPMGKCNCNTRTRTRLCAAPQSATHATHRAKRLYVHPGTTLAPIKH